MPLNFYWFSISIFSLIYFLTIILKKYVIAYFNLLAKLFSINQKISKKEKHSINTIYSFILLFLLLWRVILTYYEKYAPLSKTVFLGRNQFIYKIGIALFFFLLGLLLAKGKKIISCIFQNPIYVLKTLSLSLSTALLLAIIKNCTPLLRTAITTLNLIYLINYYQTFKKQKEKMKKLEFIYHFSWLLTINLINSSILIYNIFNI